MTRGYALVRDFQDFLRVFPSYNVKGREVQILEGNCLIKAYGRSASFIGDCIPVIERLLQKDLLIVGENKKIWAGIDEAGKGERMGPLVVAGAVVEKEKLPLIIMTGVRDSKKLSKDQISEIGSKLKKMINYHVEVLEPIKYNILYKRLPNINKILKLLVENTIDALERFDPEVIVIDRYSRKNIPERRGIKLVEKGDSKDLGVMCASVIAKYEYNNWIEDKLHKLKDDVHLYKLHFK